MPRLIDDEKRLRELGEECRLDRFGNAKFAGTLLGCDELRELLACVQALREVREWAKDDQRNFPDRCQESTEVLTIINRHTGGKS